jgi:hypothetical protein
LVDAAGIDRELRQQLAALAHLPDVKTRDQHLTPDEAAIIAKALENLP